MLNAPLQLPYYQTVERQATLSGVKVRYLTKPGISAWNEITPACALLAEAFDLPQVTGRVNVLQLGCGHGALAAVLACRHPHVWFTLKDESCIALDLAGKTQKANELANIRVMAVGCSGESGEQLYHAVLLEIPKGRKLARRHLLEAHQGLKTGGALYLAGANSAGIQSVMKDAEELFGNACILEYKKGNRCARLIKEAHRSMPEWAAEPGLAPHSWIEFNLEAGGNIFIIHSRPGIFSYDRLDEGTRLLLSCVEVHSGATVLDAGCGFGIIGLYAAHQGAGWVDLVDCYLPAVTAAQENIRLNRIDQASAFASDALQAVEGRCYDLILSNPPFHSGHAVDLQASEAFIQHAWHALAPKGRLTLVANKFIRYEKLMSRFFRKVEIVRGTGKFHVLSGMR